MVVGSSVAALAKKNVKKLSSFNFYIKNIILLIFSALNLIAAHHHEEACFSWCFVGVDKPRNTFASFPCLPLLPYSNFSSAAASQEDSSSATASYNTVPSAAAASASASKEHTCSSSATAA